MPSAPAMWPTGKQNHESRLSRKRVPSIPDPPVCYIDSLYDRLIYFPRIQFEILNIFEMFFIRRYKNSITSTRHGGNHGIHFACGCTDLPKVMLDRSENLRTLKIKWDDIYQI